MIRYSLIVTLLLVLIGIETKSQDHLVIKKDLQAEWLVYKSGSYVAYEGEDVPIHTFYIPLNAKKNTGDHLGITSNHLFSVWLNDQLLLDGKKEVRFSIDSLHTLAGESMLFFAIHQEKEIDRTTLSTQIVSLTPAVSTNEKLFILKQKTFFRDFLITAVLLLLIFLISIIRLNPRSSADYFSLSKMFSLRDNESDQFYNRLTSGSILFYGLTSIILAFYLMVINQYVKIGFGNFTVTSYFNSLLIWLEASIMIFILLFIKLALTNVIASLFGLRDIAGFHFSNFIRLLLVALGVLTLILVGYFILHGQSKGFYSFFYLIINWIMAGWIVLLFLKLINRMQYSVFHIFSYICATEIMPFLLIIKLLNE